MIVTLMTETEAREHVTFINAAVNDVYRRLVDLRDREGWRVLGYSSWSAMLESSEFTQTRRQLNNILIAGDVQKSVGSTLPNTLSVRAAVALSHYDADLQPMIARAAVARYGNVTESNVNVLGDQLQTLANSGQVYDEEGEPLALELALSAADVEKTKRRHEYISSNTKTAHVSHNSGENEWYTPTPFIEAARIAMGGIDLDPASSEIANRVVCANYIYTLQDDGLKQDWIGRVWLNPPYSQPEIGQFATKVAFEREQGHIEQICVLVNNATETAWLQNLLEIADAICFLKSRVKFLDQQLKPTGSPLQGQVVLYIGANVDAFSEAFELLGKVLYAG